MTNEQRFEVGEVAIGVGFVRDPECNGMECVILTPLQYHEPIHRLTGQVRRGLFHKVRWSDGTVTYQSPCHLKKKKPPAPTVRWEDCAWQPAGVCT